MGFIFAWGKFSRRRLYREKRENYPHAKISTFTVLSRENIVFVGIRAVYVYKILCNEIFMFFIVFLYKTIIIEF